MRASYSHGARPHGHNLALEFAHACPVGDRLSAPKPILLLILDGWGHRVETADNAIAAAHCPNWRRLLAECPHTLVDTHGLHVGLPDDQMGNSEVGHMNIGAGRVVYQDLTRIDAAIRDGSFFSNAALRDACHHARAGTLHVFGLISPGGVHSHETHVHAMLDLAEREGVTRIAVHAFLDGRDTPPKSAEPSLRALMARCARTQGARVATVSGRYYAMDRDKRWDRVEQAHRAITDAQAEFRAGDALAALAQAYERGETDEADDRQSRDHPFRARGWRGVGISRWCRRRAGHPSGKCRDAGIDPLYGDEEWRAGVSPAGEAAGSRGINTG